MAYHSGNSLPISLVRAVGQVQRMFREIAIGIAADFDLFLGEMDALMALAESGELRMGDVAKRMSISPTNATRLIKQLEGKGLVRRTRSMASNREVFACLTARGVSVNDDWARTWTWPFAPASMWS